MDGMAWGVDGNVAVGLGLPLRGVVLGLTGGPQNLSDLGGTVDHVVPPVVELDEEGTLADVLEVELYRDGGYVALVDAAGNWTLPGAAAPVYTEIGPLPVTTVEHVQVPGAGRFWSVRPVGRRVCVEWEDEPADADFVAYLIYWDAGADEVPAVLLARITNPQARLYRTAEVAAGTYRLRLEYEDAAGNISAVGVEQSAVVSPVPLAVTGLAVTYSSTTRQATVAWTPPAADPADVRAYLLMDNWNPGADVLARAANSEVGLERQVRYVAPGAGAQTFVTMELWAGVWRFNVRGLSELGVLGSAPAEVVLNLVQDGSSLVQAVAPPAAPELVDVAPLADGAYSATVRVATEVGLTALWLTEDGVDTEQVTLTGAGVYTVEGATRADGTVVVLAPRAYASATVSTLGNPIEFVADAAAPVGDGEISVRPCW